jgi:hypothetical protein
MEIQGYTVATAFQRPACGGVFTGMGVITHEFLHGFFLVDLYDQATNDARVQIGGVGSFDLMGNTYGWKYDLTRPSHLSPWSRVLVGWLTPIDIVEDGVYAIQAAEISSQIYKIGAPLYPAGEYLFIENRQPMKWDEDFPGGLVIWHIDENAPGQTLRGYPGKSDWPASHYKVAVQQADGLYEIEKGENQGNAGDFWTQGMVMGPGPNYPNTDAYSGGKVIKTGLSITVLSPSGFIMNFRVQGLGGGKAPYYPDVNSTASPIDPATQPTRVNDDNGAGKTLSWVFSMLAGVGLVMGLMVVLL